MTKKNLMKIIGKTNFHLSSFILHEKVEQRGLSVVNI